MSLLLSGAIRLPCLLIPGYNLQLGDGEIRHYLKERTGNLLIRIKPLGKAPIWLTARITGGLSDIANKEIRLQHIRAISKNLLTDLGCHIRLPIPPQRFREANPRIKAIGGLINHTAKLLDSLRQHMAFGIESGETRATQAQRGTLGSPHIRIEAQQLRAQLRHIGAYLKSLLKLSHRTIELTLALIGNAKTDVGGDVFGVRVKHTTKRRLGLVKLAPSQIRFAKDAMGLKILGEIVEDMLRHTDGLLNLVNLKEAAGLIICGLQAQCSHPGSSCCRVTERRG